jgi:hypothetical protein
MQAVYRLIWTTDLGYAGSDDRAYATIEDAQRAASPELAWYRYGRDEWKSTKRDSYGDSFTITRRYNY